MTTNKLKYIWNLTRTTSGPIFDLDEESYTIKVDGLVKQTMALKLKDLKERFEQVEVVAALQVCMFEPLLSKFVPDVPFL